MDIFSPRGAEKFFLKKSPICFSVKINDFRNHFYFFICTPALIFLNIYFQPEIKQKLMENAFFSFRVIAFKINSSQIQQHIIRFFFQKKN
jgi:hypothetical protein